MVAVGAVGALYLPLRNEPGSSHRAQYRTAISGFQSVSFKSVLRFELNARCSSFQEDSRVLHLVVRGSEPYYIRLMPKPSSFPLSLVTRCDL